jgi:hypothetical protein
MTVLGKVCDEEGGGDCRVNVSQYIEDVYDFKYSRLPLDVVMCVLMIVLFRLAALAGLARVSYMVR